MIPIVGQQINEESNMTKTVQLGKNVLTLSEANSLKVENKLKYRGRTIEHCKEFEQFSEKLAFIHMQMRKQLNPKQPDFNLKQDEEIKKYSEVELKFAKDIVDSYVASRNESFLPEYKHIESGSKEFAKRILCLNTEFLRHFPSIKSNLIPRSNDYTPEQKQVHKMLNNYVSSTNKSFLPEFKQVKESITDFVQMKASDTITDIIQRLAHLDLENTKLELENTKKENVQLQNMQKINCVESLYVENPLEPSVIGEMINKFNALNQNVQSPKQHDNNRNTLAKEELRLGQEFADLCTIKLQMASEYQKTFELYSTLSTKPAYSSLVKDPETLKGINEANAQVKQHFGTKLDELSKSWSNFTAIASQIAVSMDAMHNFVIPPVTSLWNPFGRNMTYYQEMEKALTPDIIKNLWQTVKNESEKVLESTQVKEEVQTP